MSKIFLSHSSVNKDYVRKVVEILGRDRCVFDEYTFEVGMPTMQEIVNNLNNSDIFVYFISDSALDSTWVKNELNEAQSRISNFKANLKQIFPIIIDEKITHEDIRIADFLKKDYNLRIIKSPIIASRKILEQIARLEYEKSFDSPYDCFYGRESELTAFKRRYDSPSKPPLKTAVVSGIPGIGKKSFLIKALRETMVIKNYYRPIVISISNNSGIVDLILQLCEAGFGEYTIEDMSTKNNDENISILISLLNEIQKNREIVIVEDESDSLVINGEIVYWLDSALKNSNNGFSIVITCTKGGSISESKKYPYAFFVNLLEMDKTESMGVFRTYSSIIGLDLTRDDCQYFKDIFTGYPPQITYCADLIAKENLDYVKDNSYLVYDFPEKISVQIISKCYDKSNKEYVFGILALFSKMDLIPARLINKIIKIKEEYRNIILLLKRNLVCYSVGASNEYVKVNSFIQTYISRNKAQIPEDIENVLKEELMLFNSKIDSDSSINEWDTSELKYFIKQNISNGKTISRHFIYPTLLLQSIVELYNSQKFERVIEVIEAFKDDNSYDNLDVIVVKRLQRYYCQALIKINSAKLLQEVEYFKDNNFYGDYYYLLGYYYRYNANYKKAAEFLTESLNNTKNHYAAARELALVYMTLQDFDSAILLSKKNYARNQENIFAIQQYFEALIESHSLSSSQRKDIEKMLESAKRSNEIHDTPIFYQFVAQYHAYYEEDFDLAMKTLKEAREKYQSNMYIERIYFDICRRNKNIKGMKEALDLLKASTIELKYKGILYTREAIMDSFLGKTRESILLFLNEKKMPKTCIDAIMKKCYFSK